MKNKILSVLKWIGIVLAVIVALVVILFAVLTIFEFKPKDVENVELNGTSQNQVLQDKTFTIVTWNVGYGALGDNADFFLDGGKMVNTASKNRVNENVAAISSEIKALNPDFVFMQEVDKKSKRSYRTNEQKIISDNLSEYQNSCATNYKSLYIPYPLPAIGKVNCGIMTLSKVDSTSSTRIQLPCPFSWPYRLGNLKRCLMINRIPVAGSDKELVLVNLHLEAYDSGEGKLAQTKMLRDIFTDEMNKGNYVIAGGDFNQTFSNVDMSKFPTINEKMWKPGIIDASDFDAGIQLEMDSENPSCRSLDKPFVDADKDNFQFYIIDGFIVSSNIKVNSLKTENLEFKNSDHNPVVMNVTLK